MKWKKVGRLTLKRKGELVKWAKVRKLELVRIDGEYKFFAKNGRKTFFILRRCSHCRHVNILIDKWENFHCSECREWGEAT